MKIPASSSLILATLAISSSSASLAAPTGEVPSTTGSSLHHPHAGQAMDGEEKTDAHMVERDTMADTLEERDGLVGSVVDILTGLPVVGPVLGSILVNEGNAQSAEADPEALQRLHNAVGIVSTAMSALQPTGNSAANPPIPSLNLGSMVPGLPVPTGALPFPIPGAQGVDENSDSDNSSDVPSATPSSDAPYASLPSQDATPTGDPATAGESQSSDGSFLISPTTTIASAEEATPAPQDPGYLSTSDAGTPTSPGVPSGPPNTPVPVSSAPASD